MHLERFGGIRLPVEALQQQRGIDRPVNGPRIAAPRTVAGGLPRLATPGLAADTPGQQRRDALQAAPPDFELEPAAALAADAQPRDGIAVRLLHRLPRQRSADRPRVGVDLGVPPQVADRAGLRRLDVRRPRVELARERAAETLRAHGADAQQTAYVLDTGRAARQRLHRLRDLQSVGNRGRARRAGVNDRQIAIPERQQQRDKAPAVTGIAHRRAREQRVRRLVQYNVEHQPPVRGQFNPMTAAVVMRAAAARAHDQRRAAPRREVIAVDRVDDQLRLGQIELNPLRSGLPQPSVLPLVGVVDLHVAVALAHVRAADRRQRLLLRASRVQAVDQHGLAEGPQVERAAVAPVTLPIRRNLKLAAPHRQRRISMQLPADHRWRRRQRDRRRRIPAADHRTLGPGVLGNQTLAPAAVLAMLHSELHAALAAPRRDPRVLSTLAAGTRQPLFGQRRPFLAGGVERLQPQPAAVELQLQLTAVRAVTPTVDADHELARPVPAVPTRILNANRDLRLTARHRDRRRDQPAIFLRIGGQEALCRRIGPPPDAVPAVLELNLDPPVCEQLRRRPHLRPERLRLRLADPRHQPADGEQQESGGCDQRRSAAAHHRTHSKPRHQEQPGVVAPTGFEPVLPA